MTLRSLCLPSIRSGLSDIFGDLPLTHTLVRANKIVVLFHMKCKFQTNGLKISEGIIIFVFKTIFKTNIFSSIYSFFIYKY